MILSELFVNQTDIQIDNIFVDSRVKVKNGLFVCQKGLRSDSHHYVEDAIKNGAVAVVYSEDISEVIARYKQVVFIKVTDTLAELNRITNVFYDYPSSKMDVYAVTGTNGKTSTAYILHDILAKFEKTSYNGTAGYKIVGEVGEGVHFSTPPTLEMTKLLNTMVQKESASVCLEMSSHALKMRRVDNVDVDVAIFTNLSRDHLDYHKTMEDYFASKLKLFTSLKSSALAVINLDDEYAEEIIKHIKSRVVTYGKSSKADYRIVQIDEFKNETKFIFEYNNVVYQAKTNVLGGINVFNIVSAIASLVETGRDMTKVLKAVEDVDFAIGRFQNVKNNKTNVIVDYAHTPDGFKKFFEFTNNFKTAETRIISVFGSAGKRDKGKRPILGEIASENSDIIVLTEEDHRDEAVVDICNDIKAGIKNDCEVHVVEDRAEAIQFAISLAQQNDIVVILGKGVETFLDKGDITFDYKGDDYYASFS